MFACVCRNPHGVYSGEAGGTFFRLGWEHASVRNEGNGAGYFSGRPPTATLSVAFSSLRDCLVVGTLLYGYSHGRSDIQTRRCTLVEKGR